MEYLTLDNVNMSFHSHHVLKDITLHIKKGEFISLLGPSGSGKSTLFHLIGGLLHPDSGHIYLNNKEITNKKGHISYMPQTPSLFPWRTLLENVMLIQELSGKKEKEKAIAMLHKAGLSSFIHEYPSALSGGMQQRASFIRALLSEKDILLLDEPFGALDEFTRLDMQQWLLNLWEQYKRTILFITHNIEEALFLSDRIFVISKNPARIIKEVIVPFNRPRQQNLYFHQEFLQYKQELYSYLKEGFDEFHH
ncbi:MAG TPA: ABC transporter ATP-binding protein [Niallia sp.]|nr:ABC transporter ATP-binding protein [Niallia sp.]